ncbi:hypothetical protein EON79_00525 [bacterium]|nr:MAG: hypothetical protein EON79_00525 [bacterium]
MRLRNSLALLVSLSASLALAQGSPETAAHLPSQAAADALRSAAGTDAAFIAAGLVKEGSKDDLATILQYPTDEVVVVSLTGAQVKQALERSLSFYPQPNGSFLQLSGFEVVFSKSAASNSRIVSITANGARLDESKTYTVAMPANLGRGGLGYFRIWDKSKITKTLTGATLESVLKGKKYVETSPRWVAQP